MMRFPKLLALGLLLALGAGAWATIGYYRQQNRLYVQLEQLGNVLTIENDQLFRQADNTISSIQAAVAKNHNLPADVAVLRRAENLRGQVKNLESFLYTCVDELRGPTNYITSTSSHPAASVGQVLNPARQRTLQQQVAALADTLRRLEPAGTPPLTAPAFASALPVVEALADLVQLESVVLDHQARALQHLEHSVGAPALLADKLLAAASAEANVVAPGDTYRAELLLVNHFGPGLRMEMRCNGRPVPVDADGVGLVRFRAPLTPGPATWTGTVRMNNNGRDTTFVVQVPYRVARH